MTSMSDLPGSTDGGWRPGHPPKTGQYLVWVEPAILGVHVQSIRMSKPAPCIAGRFLWDYDGKITHWMPLPEPPK